MALIADSGAIYTLYDSDDRNHRSVRKAIDRDRGPIIIPTAVLAEVDYLLREFLGVDAELDFLSGLIGGAYTLEAFTDTDLLYCRDLIKKYRNLDLGLADATVIATAERLAIDRILTTDERDFRVVRSLRGRPFVLVPSDEPP